MSNKSPVFPIPAESHHFSDYGFDPQIDYFQVLEEAKRHRRDNNDDNNLSSARSIDSSSLHFKLQKPASKDDSKRLKWWRNVMLFLRRRLVQGSRPRPYGDESGGIEQIRCRGPYIGSISGPLYLTESRSSSGGSSTPYRSSSGPVSRMLTPARIGEVEVPYISLRELNIMEVHHEPYKVAERVWHLREEKESEIKRLDQIVQSCQRRPALHII